MAVRCTGFGPPVDIARHRKGVLAAGRCHDADVTATIASVDDFKALVAEVEARPGYRRPLAYAFGVATTAGDKIVDARFLVVNHEESYGTVAALADHLGELVTGHRPLTPTTSTRSLARLAPYRGQPGHANIDALERLRANYPREHPFAGHGYQPVAAVLVDADDPPATAVDVYLRLHLLSMRRMPPRSLNLDGQFGKLNTNVWTTEGVVDQAALRRGAAAAHHRGVTSGGPAAGQVPTDARLRVTGRRACPQPEQRAAGRASR